MGLIVLVTGYIAAALVLIVQPARIAWGLLLLTRPPKGRYLNRTVLALSLFIKATSLLLAGYMFYKFSPDSKGLFSPVAVKFMIPPFTLYLMSELVARFIYQHSDEQI